MTPSRLLSIAAVVCATLGQFGCAPADDASTEPETTLPTNPGGKADIYGTDDRTELFKASAAHQALARSTALIVADHQISSSGGVTTLRTNSWSEHVRLTRGLPMCSSEPFREQPTAGGCSGFLVAPDLVATAGHCVNMRNDCEDMRFIFGYGYESAAEMGSLDVTRVPDSDVYSCAAVIGHRYDQDAATLDDLVSGYLWSDWAVVRLDRPATGREPLKLRRSGRPEVGDLVHAVGHPGGIPTKVTAGRLVDVSQDLYVNSDLDIYQGNSGSVVFNTNDEIEGIVIRGSGGQSFNPSPSDPTCMVSDACTDFDATSHTCTGNQVMRVDPLLQFVDAAEVRSFTKPGGNGLTDSIGGGTGPYIAEFDVDLAGDVRFVTLDAGISHQKPRELRITLERADTGHSDPLFTKATLQQPGASIYSRTSDAFDGEPAAGRWRVRIEDADPSNDYGQWVNYVTLHIGTGARYEPPVDTSFVGSTCASDADCTFADGAWCFRWQSSVVGAAGMCMLPCEGYCPDRPGFATTFCTEIPSLGGQCLPQPHAANAYCSGAPGTAQIEVARYLGSSDADAAVSAVCYPAP